ncbi:MAG: L,D-transpeptidase family protein [Lachnospiraceae bacterium]|nr:L,D-transpeptidase family protein [Lachnospiraceae bacterium]
MGLTDKYEENPMRKMIIPAVVAAAGIFCFSAFAGGLGKSAIVPAHTQAGPGPGVQASVGFAITETPAAGADAAGKETTAWDPAKAAVPADARVMMTLEGSRSEDHGIFRIYTRSQETNGGLTPWTLALETAAMSGRNGLYKEVEGDKKTPVGIFKMNTPFGILPAQEGFPSNYVQADERFYWVGNSDSPMYNRFVRSDIFTEFDPRASEQIVRYPGYYNYCIDTGYNPEGIPYRGSAIFLHCVVDGQNTAGCIAIPEADMVTAMKLYREGTSYMVIFDRDNIGAVYAN